MSDYNGAIDTIEKALLGRYNVAALEGELAEAVTTARAGNLDGLTKALDGRVLYQWQGTVDAALAEAQGFGSVGEAEPEKPLYRMNKADLLALAADRGVDVPDGATVAQVRDLLAEEPAETEQEPPEVPGPAESEPPKE